MTQLIYTAYEDILGFDQVEKKLNKIPCQNVNDELMSFIPAHLRLVTKVFKIKSIDWQSSKLQCSQETNNIFLNPCGVFIQDEPGVRFGIVMQLFSVENETDCSIFAEVLIFYGSHYEPSFDAYFCQKFGLKKVVKLEEIIDRCMFTVWNKYYMVTSKVLMNNSFEGIDHVISSCFNEKS